MVGNYKVVTLCGSTKFKDEFMAEQKRLTLEGCIVISVGLFSHSGDTEAMSEETKTMLDNMHKRKIDMADSIHIINKDGYIGSSTKSEIAYAVLSNKQVTVMDDSEEAQAVISGFINTFNEFFSYAKYDPDTDVASAVFEKYGIRLEEVPNKELLHLL